MELARQILICGVLAAAVMTVAPSARAQIQSLGFLCELVLNLCI